MERYDVVILGAGLAGLTLARQILLECPGKRILHLEKRKSVPGTRQKVGESTVQVGGYYLSKILDLEEHLWQDHFMKYNLRFLWKTPGLENRNYEDYSQAYIQKFSNIASYQVDRNRLEAYLIEINRTNNRYRLETGCTPPEVCLSEDESPHRLSYLREGKGQCVLADWLVDTTGPNRHMSRKLQLDQPVELPHASVFFWVDGLVNIERLTDSDHASLIRHPARRMLGHLPMWLSTNHLMGKSYWLWLIPLKTRTSIGLVFDTQAIDITAINTAEKFRSWLMAEWPLLAHGLRERPMIDFSLYRNYAKECRKTLHANRFAISGMAGRFGDPLYSPGSDLIGIHNTLITDLIACESVRERQKKLGAFESMCKIAYRSFLPTFREGYPPLGDQECMCLKYTWELGVYFAFFVFPFINRLFTDRLFLAGYFRRFAALGAINATVLAYIRDFQAWKERHGTVPFPRPRFFDFLQVPSLARSEKAFYRIDLSVKQALAELDDQLVNLQNYALWVLVYVDAWVTRRPDLMHNPIYISALDINSAHFDPEAAAERARLAGNASGYSWPDPIHIFHDTFHAQENRVPQSVTANPGVRG